MRTYDLTPFYRSTVGFDRLFSLLDQVTSDGSPGYPPYNIERTGENAYRISVAVSGFSQAELSIVAKENTLTIKAARKPPTRTPATAPKCSIAASPPAPSSASSSLPTSCR
ncbi:HSP20 family molecular chaperone IbpA [Bradyrhizobium sp. JR6.1]